MEIRERIKWDVREGIVGAAIFNPKHVIIVTWKNVTFAGGSVNTNAKYVVSCQTDYRFVSVASSSPSH